MTATEAVIDGERTFDEVRDLVSKALRQRERASGGGTMYPECWVIDMTGEEVVYECDSGLKQCSYELNSDGTVSLGEPYAVVRSYVAISDATESEEDDDEDEAEQATEAVVDQLPGRVIEAKGTDANGGRVFRVRIVAAGVSKNRRRYTEAVLRKAAHLYEGAKAFDHHRTEQELATSTIEGLVGSYRNVEAEADGIYGDLHLLPSAARAAEALDASIAAQEAGLEPLVGISHDVRATFKVGSDQHGRLQEAEEIVSVDSADIVAKPSAGGKAVRVVAGGDQPNEEVEESEVPTKAEILAAFKEASDDELAAVGLTRPPAKTTESTAPTQRVTEGERTTEADTLTKGSTFANMLVRAKFEDAAIPVSARESIVASLGDQFTEADVDKAIKGMKDAWALMERGGLAPAAGGAQVTKESFDKKVEALDAFFEPGNSKGYKSFRHAIEDISGVRQRNFDEDHNRTLMRECVAPFDSGSRTTESLSAASFAEVLGDSITRRMVAEYARPSLQTWRQIVSNIAPVTDFRTQRVGRVGGYGTLPVVAEGAPYQPLTSPGDEESTYAITKKGGTEDITLEMIANDDVRVISKIPFKLGLAAAQTLYRFLFDILPTNANTTYDSTALFHANHANTDNPAVLGQSTLSAGRKKMRKQAAYGDSSDVLSIIPRTIVVPSDLEEIAFQLSRSAVAIPSTAAGPSDTPNIHQNLDVIIVDYYSDANDWYLVADPSMCPTIEVGFYQGRQEPELFTQNDNSSGSMFNADLVTYKIRHIYSGTVLDHRGFYRGNN